MQIFNAMEVRRSSQRKVPLKFSSEAQIVKREVKLWTCTVCKRVLSTKESLRRHVLTQHIKQKVHHCQACDKAFVLPVHLKLHIREEHSPAGAKEVLPCMCGRKFTKRNSLLSHIRHFHHPAPNIRPACSVCHKVFNDSATVRVHEARVHGEKKVLCDYPECGKLFATVGLKNAHYRYHEKREFKCDICGRSFSTAGYRDKHRLTHAGVRQHACSDCGRQFITASQLGMHRRRSHQSGSR